MYFLQWGRRKKGKTGEGPCKPSVPPFIIQAELASATSSTRVGFATDATCSVQRKSDASAFVYQNFIHQVKVGSKAKAQNSTTTEFPPTMLELIPLFK